MLTFLDGPAKGKADGLCIRRCPRFLRVVVSERGEWDALDLIEDRVRYGETVYVYQLVENHGTIHLRRSDSHGHNASGRFVRATWRLVDPQPDREIVTSNKLWAQWAVAENEKRKMAEEEQIKQAGWKPIEKYNPPNAYWTKEGDGRILPTRKVLELLSRKDASHATNHAERPA